MNLSPAEVALVEILRGKVGITFALTITKIDAAVVVTMALAGNGFSIGSGPSFEAAFNSMAGVEPTSDELLSETPRRAQH